MVETSRNRRISGFMFPLKVVFYASEPTPHQLVHTNDEHLF